MAGSTERTKDLVDQPAPLAALVTRSDVTAAWTRLGGGFSTTAAVRPVDVEALIARTAELASGDYRLFMVASTWLAEHHGFVNTRRLGRFLDALGGRASAVAGAILSVAAHEAPSAEALRAAATHARPLATPEPLFDVAEWDVLYRERVERTPLPLLAAWGLLHDEISLKHGAVRPVRWVLRHCPELRFRAVLGPGLEADILAAASEAPQSISALRERMAVTYAAAHGAVERLVGRGLVRTRTQGRARVVYVPAHLTEWFNAFTTAAAVAA